MGIKTKVIASLRGRKDKPAYATIFGCVNTKCHPATILRGQENGEYKCATCEKILKPILIISASQNERVTASAQNITEGASFIFLTRCLISTRKKKREKFFFHKGILERTR